MNDMTKHLFLLSLECLGRSLRSLICYQQSDFGGQIYYSSHNRFHLLRP